MPPIVPGIIVVKLCLWNRITLRLSALLAVRPNARPWSFPSLTLTWLSDAARTIAMSVFGEWPTWSSRLLSLLSVDIVQAVDAAPVVLAADVEVEAKGSHG